MSAGFLNLKKYTGKATKKTVSTIILIAGILGIVLIFLSEFVHPKAAAAASCAASQNSLSDYQTQTSKDLEGIIGQISGVGRVKVLVTVESSTENVYETDNKQSNETQNGSNATIQQNSESSHVILDDENGSKQALLSKQLSPVVKGVVVVCDGGANPDVQENVTNAVSIALGIPTNRISINRMQPESH